MQLVLSFSTLLASLLLALSLTENAVARPYRRDAGIITLPLKRIPQRDDVHPQVLLQQHINRGLRRHARMTGRAPPSDLELRENLRKRLYIPPGGRQALPGKREEKRFNRQGLNPITSLNQGNKASVKTNNAVDDENSGTFKSILDALSQGLGGAKDNQLARHHRGGNRQGGSGTATAEAAAASGTGAGFSEVDLTAALNGGLTEADDPTASDSLGLDIEANDVGYIATVQIGTPGQDFKLLMDSGSADLWVGSENCVAETGGGDCGNHTFLGTQSSSSFVDTGKQFEVTYGSGHVSGDIVTDDLSFAGLSLNTHTFGVANTESVDFSSDSTTFDGLMGLAQSTLSNQGVLTPVESLAKAGSISAAITSFKLGRISDGNNDGEVTFGGLDTSKFDTSTLTELDNVSQVGFWEASMDAVTVDGQDTGLQGRTAILDTGTTLIIAPDADAQAVHAAIPGAKSAGQGSFTIPCTTTASVALTFGGRSFAINPTDLLFLPVDQNDLTGDCVSGISSGQIGGATEWLVGDVFLKNAYFSTDVDKNTISLASLV
ncbi:acid protease [Pyrrhoderma noxium]|uniref:Acid protease n=1 Tax=Pyrrhoderma noxium TaxID=2282107 RepID=A0A286UAF1_9AGAM|nr:acid protease [Pyrrhoderma noxium]